MDKQKRFKKQELKSEDYKGMESSEGWPWTAWFLSLDSKKQGQSENPW